MVKKIRDFRKDDRPEAHASSFYFNGLRDEIEEVAVEIQDDNVVYLEDELSDILRDYMNLLYLLEDEGKIDSRESVFEKSWKKFSERVDDQFAGGTRKETKERQKRCLKEEHMRRYV